MKKDESYSGIRIVNVYGNDNRQLHDKGRIAMTTIKDIARLSGYSIGTVSRVINNHPDVSAEARQRIEDVIRETNFQPNSNAKHLKQTVQSAITILVKGTKNVFLETILEEIQKLLREHGEDVNVVFLDEMSNEVETAAQLCLERRPKGLIFLGGNREFFRKEFSSITVPSVLVTDYAASLGYNNLSSFATDDIQAARDAVDYLIQAGHTKIGIVGGSENTESGHVGSLRRRGAIEQLEKSGIGFDAGKFYEPCRFNLQAGYDATVSLLKRTPEITAVFAIGDIVAIGAVRAAKDLGYKVPEEISVIGFDGIEYTKYSIPRITTVRQDTSLLARRCVEDLLFRLNYSRPAVHEMISYEVVAGESVYKPRN